MSCRCKFESNDGLRVGKTKYIVYIGKNENSDERCGLWASLISRGNCDVFVACTEELIPEFDFVIQAFMVNFVMN